MHVAKTCRYMDKLAAMLHSRTYTNTVIYTCCPPQTCSIYIVVTVLCRACTTEQSWGGYSKLDQIYLACSSIPTLSSVHFNLYWITQSSLASYRVGASTQETQTCSLQLYNYWCSNLSVFLLAVLHCVSSLKYSYCSAWHFMELNFCSLMSQIEATNHNIPPFTKAPPLSMLGITHVLMILPLLMHQKPASHT